MSPGTKHDVHKRHEECGEGLVDAIVASAILALILAATLGAVAASLRNARHFAVGGALRSAAQREARIAVDLLKYRGASIPPNSIATSVPLTGASPLPVMLSITTAANADGSTTIVVRAAHVGGLQGATARAVAPVPVPLPSSDIPASVHGAAPL